MRETLARLKTILEIEKNILQQFSITINWLCKINYRVWREDVNDKNKIHLRKVSFGLPKYEKKLFRK